MRGTQRWKIRDAKWRGIIPAYAGNTLSALCCRIRLRDHPRVCGEHDFYCPHSPRTTGSSPRMRGTRTPASRESVQNGIIPAYAGNTSLSGNLEDFGGDHPRVCGEHVRNDRAIEARAGSSPRMRGTPATGTIPVSKKGIIPAYAGNTPDGFCSIVRAGDHPRVCGEHCCTWALIPAMAGSSPRMRGTLFRWCCSRYLERDHPRVCGEHYVPIIAAYNLMGSSPRMRGTH